MAMEPMTRGCRIEALTKKSATWMVSGPATTRVPLLPSVPEDMLIWFGYDGDRVVVVRNTRLVLLLLVYLDHRGRFARLLMPFVRRPSLAWYVMLQVPRFLYFCSAFTFFDFVMYHICPADMLIWKIWKIWTPCLLPTQVRSCKLHIPSWVLSMCRPRTTDPKTQNSINFCLPCFMTPRLRPRNSIHEC